MDRPLPPEASLPPSWREIYHLHIDEIDAQHDRLVLLVEALRELSVSAELIPVLNALDSFIGELEWHCLEEEQFMRRHKYPHVADHQRVHADFVEHCRQLRRDVESERFSLTPDMCDPLRHWLGEHILTHDRPYCAYYRPPDTDLCEG